MRCREASLTDYLKSSSLFWLLGFSSSQRLRGGDLLLIQLLLVLHRQRVLRVSALHLGLVGLGGAGHLQLMLLLRALRFVHGLRVRYRLLLLVLRNLLLLILAVLLAGVSHVLQVSDVLGG